MKSFIFLISIMGLSAHAEDKKANNTKSWDVECTVDFLVFNGPSVQRFPQNGFLFSADFSTTDSYGCQIEKRNLFSDDDVMLHMGICQPKIMKKPFYSCES